MHRLYNNKILSYYSTILLAHGGAVFLGGSCSILFIRPYHCYVLTLELGTKLFYLGLHTVIKSFYPNLSKCYSH